MNRRSGLYPCFSNLSIKHSFDGDLPMSGQNSDEEPSSRGKNSDEEPSSRTSLSNYSSCDGSEYDRYCSANSILGTASVCSSIANRSDLLDSYRSLGFDEDLENCGGGERVLRGGNSRVYEARGSGRSDCLSDEAADSLRENGSYENHVLPRTSNTFPGITIRSKSFLGSTEVHRHGSMHNMENEGMNKLLTFQMDSDAANGCDNSGGSSSNHDFFSESHAPSGFAVDEDTTLKCGYSDDDEGTLDSRTDEDVQIRSCRRVDLQAHKAANRQNVNVLLMGSSVAFGDDDWGGFLQETEGDDTMPLAFVPLHETKPIMKPDTHTVSSFKEGIYDKEDGSDVSLSDDIKHCNSRKRGTLSVDDDGVSTQEPLASVGVTDLTSSTYDAGNLKGHADVEPPFVYGKELSPIESGESGLDLFHVNDGKPMNFISTNNSKFDEVNTNEELKPMVLPPFPESCDDFTKTDKKTVSEVGEKLDTNECLDDMFLEMEEILLNCEDSRQTRYSPGGSTSDIRDGSSTASTSGNNDTYPIRQFTVKIEWVEVVGAKQKKGDVSFGERLIGVKEYTVYKLLVWSSKDQWEVERRYRDFFSLYSQLKKWFEGHSLSLPSPWSKVNQDSRKFFGNASPTVVAQRSSLIQDCLQSILNSRLPFGMPAPFVWFLTPSNDVDISSSNKSLKAHHILADDVKSNSSYSGETHLEGFALGKTISLVVEMKFQKSTRQLLEEQHYTCAGCHRHLDCGNTLMKEFVQTLGWGKPRFCEYTGQLFCAACHTNDTAVLPARVLHSWDFTLYPVSQLAKAYLDSIHDQPMLCVNAVNPVLFSKIPALRHVMDIRRKNGAMLPYVRCLFRRSIQRSLGSRKYLLENNDFFAVRDLVDLSKGAFATLPVMIEIICNKILHHITHDCLECYDVGIPCAAKEACGDPSSSILPFQVVEAVRCGLCRSIFHEPCIRKLGGCPCSKLASHVDHCAVQSTINSFDDNKLPELPIESSNGVSNWKSSSRFFSDLLAMAKPPKLWKSRTNNLMIHMNPLPSSSA